MIIPIRVKIDVIDLTTCATVENTLAGRWRRWRPVRDFCAAARASTWRLSSGNDIAAIATVCTRAFGANGGNHPKFTLHIQFRSLVRAGLRVYCMHYDFITQEGEESFLWCVHSTRSETLCGYFSLLEINFSTFCLENEKLFISFRYSTFLNR